MPEIKVLGFRDFGGKLSVFFHSEAQSKKLPSAKFCYPTLALELKA
jgi:hypothetical protein